ncbi:MAG: hypothetical protein VKL42_04370 [Snowella sp.]|nr:hypothetical protein [Snowella sp.]
MFIDNPDLNELRQGDIIQGLFYPEISCSEISLIGKPANILVHETIGSGEEQLPNLIANLEKKSKQGLSGFTAQINVYYGFFIVISQCCDLAKRDDGKPKSLAFVTAPLLDIPYTIKNNQEKLNVLKSNNLETYISSFFIAQQPPLTKDYSVDFNQIVSFPKTQYDFLLKNKILQMTDETRIQFKLKLSSHFGRATQEERDAGLYPQL